ncbi:MAG TPA: hypothetical protein VN920_01950 [Pyrinomonadaceae bacterium]|nr:hypothetical protein [Pyrinomonadaceae bacterium]
MDTLGWYLWRYYYYSKEVITELRDDWTHSTDPTLYGDLQNLWDKLLEYEIGERNKKKGTGERRVGREELEQELIDKKERFIKAEKGLYTRDLTPQEAIAGLGTTIEKLIMTEKGLTK